MRPGQAGGPVGLVGVGEAGRVATARSTADDLQRLVAAAQQARDAGDTAGMRSALQSVRTQVVGARTSKVSSAAQKNLPALIDATLAML